MAKCTESVKKELDTAMKVKLPQYQASHRACKGIGEPQKCSQGVGDPRNNKDKNLKK